MSHAIPVEVVRASVVAGLEQTPYLAAGSGTTVVVLSEAPLELATILSGVPSGVRVVAPVRAVSEQQALAVPGARRTTENFATWLDDFLDALGVQDVGLVADEHFAAAALGYTLIARERVRGLVVVQRSDGVDAASPVKARLDGGPTVGVASIGANDVASVMLMSVGSFI